MPTLCSWVSLLCVDISSKCLGVGSCIDSHACTCFTYAADVSLSYGHDAVVACRRLSVLLCLQCSMCMTSRIAAVPATLLKTASHCILSGLFANHAIMETLYFSYVSSLQPQLHTELLPGQTLIGESQANSWWVGAGQILGAQQGGRVLMPLPCSAKMLQAKKFRSVCLAHLLVRHSQQLLLRVCRNHFLSAAYHIPTCLHLHSSKASMGTQNC